MDWNTCRWLRDPLPGVGRGNGMLVGSRQMTEFGQIRPSEGAPKSPPKLTFPSALTDKHSDSSAPWVGLHSRRMERFASALRNSGSQYD